MPATVQRQVDAEPLDIAPLVSAAPQVASVAAAQESPAVVGLIGDRAIEPVAADYAKAVDSAALPVAAPASERSRGPAVQLQPMTSASAPGVAIARSTSGATTPATSWTPSVLPVSRSLPGINRPAPTQPVQFAATESIAAQFTPPALSTELVVQRAGGTAELEATHSPTAANGHAEAAVPASHGGSTSPTEVDTLVRRLYDPIVRRLKAELQLDRERAGHSLDLRH